MTISYTDKVNKRVIGSEASIVGETHQVGITGAFTVTPDQIRLIEIPLQESPASIVIAGFSEVTTSPGVNEFKVDYTNGRIIFHPSRNGQFVFVDYKGRGSIVDAEDINELQTPVGSIANSDGTLTDGIVRPLSISTNPSDDFTFPNDVIVTGNLTVQGTTTSINTETVTIEDNIILLNSNFTGSPTLDSGLEVERGDDPNVFWMWNETLDAFVFRNTSGSDLFQVFDSGAVIVTGDLTVTGLLAADDVRADTYLSATSMLFDIDEDNNSSSESFTWRTDSSSVLMTLDENGDLVVTGNVSAASISGPAVTDSISSNTGITYDIDADNNSTSELHTWRTNGSDVLMTLNESGLLTVNGNISATDVNATNFNGTHNGNVVSSDISNIGSILFGIDSDNDSTLDSFTWQTDGSTALMTLTEAGLLTVNGDISATTINATDFNGTLNGTHIGNVISTDMSSTTGIVFGIDSDNDSSVEAFIWQTDGSTELARIDEDGDFKVTGRIGINIDPIANFHNAGSTVFGLATDTDPASIPVSTVDNNTGIVITTTGSVSVTIPTPTNTTLGRFFTVLHESSSTGTLSVNGSNINSGKGSTFMWDGSAWIPVGATGGFETVSGDPASPVAADVWFDTTTNQFKGYNGTDIVILG